MRDKDSFKFAIGTAFSLNWSIHCLLGELWSSALSQQTEGLSDGLHFSVLLTLCSQLSVLLRALSIFIPGCWRKNLLCEWQTTPLRVTDLSSYKLIGLAKGPQSSGSHAFESLRKYITLMDFDDNILWTPPFKSSFIENVLLPPKRNFTEESSFLAYIHCELFTLASKASLYYQMCCVGIVMAGPSEPNQRPPLTTMTNEEILRKFCPSAPVNSAEGVRAHPFDFSMLSQLPSTLRENSRLLFAQAVKGVLDASDMPLVEALAEVIKEQQATELNELDSRFPILRLFEMPTERVTNQTKKT
jgi:hypothetical protein